MTVNIGWDPITTAEKQMPTPVVEKDAGVEALFWRIHVMDEFVGGDLERALYHYVRLKVFNDKGKEQAATIDIEHDENTSILHIAGRTIKADGAVIELKKDAVHERDLLRAGRFRRRAMSFSMPAVEPGAIVEYRWKEVRHKPNIFYMRLQMQREFPVQKVSYHVKPLPADQSAGYRMSLRPFNCNPSPLQRDKQDFSMTVLENVPAFREEPMMPAQPNVRPWLLVFYHNKPNRDAEAYWDDVGKDVYRELKQTIKLSNEIKQAAEKAIAGAKEDDKIPALIRYIRANTRGLFDGDVTDAERLKIIRSMPKERRRNSAEILESGIGTPNELNTLFAAMATHAGLDARPVLIADRTDLYFDPRLADRYFLTNIDMAVKQGETWKIFDVSAKRLPPNMLTWQEAGMPVLISDPKKPYFITSAGSKPEESLTKRTARITLSADGALEGVIQERYTGYAALEKRLQFSSQSEARNLEQLKDEITRAFPKAEVTNIDLKNVDNAEQPLLITFNISAPQYAQRTGKRMFLQPLIFQRGAPPMFPSAERTHEVEFPHAWQEADEVYIQLPQGYQLDGADSPGNMSFGPTGGYTLTMGVMEGSTLFCRRNLTFGANDVLMFQKQTYGTLKKVFDEVHRRDNHTIALKQGGPQ